MAKKEDEVIEEPTLEDLEDEDLEDNNPQNSDEETEKETVETPIGHPNRREEAETLLKEKFVDNMSSHFSEEKAKDIWDKILLIDVDSEFKEIIKLLSND